MPRASTGWRPAANDNLPADDQRFEDHVRLAKLVHTIGILAYDKSLTAPDAMRRIRDALGTFYDAFDDPDEA